MPKVCVEFDPQEPGGPSVSTFTQLIGNGTQTEFPIQHNLGHREVQLTAYDVNTGEVLTDQSRVYLTDANRTTIRFDTAPAVNGVRVTAVVVRSAE